MHMATSIGVMAGLLMMLVAHVVVVSRKTVRLPLRRSHSGSVAWMVTVSRDCVVTGRILQRRKRQSTLKP